MTEKFRIFAHEYVVSLFPAFNLVDAINIGVKKILGTPVFMGVKIQNRVASWCQLPSSWQAAHLALVAKLKKDSAFLKKICRKIEILGQKQVKATAVPKSGWANKNNGELLTQYERFLKSNFEIYVYGLLIVLLDYQDTTFISDELKKILNSRSADEYFEILTTPWRDTYNKQQDIDLLRIFSKIKKEKIEPSKAVKKHAAKYAWVSYVYEGPPAVPSYFLDILKDFARRNLNPDKALKEHQQHKKFIQSEQKRIIKKLKLNLHEAQLVAMAREVVFFKAYRRELQSHAYYNLEFLLREIGKRLALSLGQVRMMLPGEVRTALLKGVVNARELNKRLQLVVYANTPTKIICLSDQAAKKYVDKNIDPEPKVKKTNTVIGTVAYRGQARGLVKIVNSPDDMVKMKEGDILVSAATNPNLMPAIRKAASIVTDEGGLTCHAAIVAREFKIPCVIGTKIATKVFRDGDRVEVDAEKGIVKKI